MRDKKQNGCFEKGNQDKIFTKKSKCTAGKNWWSKLKNKKRKGNLLIFSSSISNTNYDFIYRIPIVEGNSIYIFMQSTEPWIIFNNLPGILCEFLKIVLYWSDVLNILLYHLQYSICATRNTSRISGKHIFILPKTRWLLDPWNFILYVMSKSNDCSLFPKKEVAKLFSFCVDEQIKCWL